MGLLDNKAALSLPQPTCVSGEQQVNLASVFKPLAPIVVAVAGAAVAREGIGTNGRGCSRVSHCSRKTDERLGG